MGNPARRIPRSTARAISLWLANRTLPLLAYRTTRRTVMGCTRVGPGVAAAWGARALPISDRPPLWRRELLGVQLRRGPPSAAGTWRPAGRAGARRPPQG